MAHTTPFAGGLAFVAALAMSATISTSASAASVPAAPSTPITGSTMMLSDGFRSSSYNPADHINDWRRCGWRGCYRRGWRGRGWRGRGWRGRRGVSAGDVLAGAVIVGGIAAIASAASNNRRNERDVVVVERDPRPDFRRDDRRDDRSRQFNPRSTGSSGLDSAVSQCRREIERDVRIDEVDGATRVASGWVVTGRIFDGSGFACEIGNDGRISDIRYGGFRSSSSSSGPSIGGEPDAAWRANGQRSDDFYASARASANTTTYSTADRFADASQRPAEPLVPLTAERLPAYPGGPIPGEEIDE